MVDVSAIGHQYAAVHRRLDERGGRLFAAEMSWDLPSLKPGQRRSSMSR